MKKIRPILILVCMFAFQIPHIAAQERKISIQVQDATLKEIIQEIEKKTDYLFFYNKDDIEQERKKSVNIQDKNMSEALTDIFKDKNIQFIIEKNNIILRKKDTGNENMTRVISGTVIDNHGETIIGANVVEKGTTNGVVTNIDGQFSIKVNTNAVLQFSYIGYVTQEVSVRGKSTLEINLIDDAQALDEVVVVGYGTIRRGELTSSIASVKSESFKKGAVQDAAQLLQGKVAGLGVIQPDGDPTVSTQIILRGVGTLKSATSPLVIIDGVPGDFTTVAAEDIESIDVVKDGSAAAIYGTRGNNGVIFITTKKVRGELPPTIEVNAYMTTQQIKKKLPMMNATEYRKLVSDGILGATDFGYDTNWLDEITRTPFSWVTNMSLKGGSSRTNYIANVNYNSNQGIIKRSDNNIFTSRLEVNHAMWDDKLKFNLNIMGKEQRYTALGEGTGFSGGIYQGALTFNPTERAKDDEGNWNEHIEIHLNENPLALLHETSGENKNTQIRSFGTVTFTPIPQLFVKVLGSRTSYNAIQGYSESKKHISTIRDNKNGYASRKTYESKDNLLELTSQYKETFGKHDITALVGYSYQDYITENFRMTNWDFPSDQYSYNNMSAGAALKRGEANESSWKEESRLIGFFGRINYNYDQRYILSASVRHEGSSKFGDDHKWGTFPAFSAGWNLSNEEFMEEIKKTLSTAKFRVGFGVTGTVPDDPYISLSQLKTEKNFYTSSGWISTIEPSSNPNPDLRWEKKEEWNLGIDFGFLNDRINGSFDFYKRTTKDMLWDYQVALPPFLYSEVTANAGVMENKGLEINLNFIPVMTSNFSWSSNINYSTNKNKLISLSNDQFQVNSGFIDIGYTGEPIQQYTHRLVEGGKVGDFYGLKVVDIDDDGRWIIEDKDGNPKPIIEQQPDDKQIIGNGLPTQFLNWNNTLVYKGFNLSITMRGAFGFDILNMPKMFFDNPVFLAKSNILNTAFDPKLNNKTLSSLQELQYIDYYIEKGNYWKIDNITLGYTVNFKNNYLKRLNVYITGNNLFTITKYSGMDPEVNIQGLDPGCDTRERYPSTRTFSLGTILTF